MGEVVNARFGVERDWEATRLKIEQGLLEIGPLFGDSEELMRAKARVVFLLLRAIIDGAPPVHVNAFLPEDLTDDQLIMVRQAVEAAALAGVGALMQHAVGCFMESIYDIATSKLRGPK